MFNNQRFLPQLRQSQLESNKAQSSCAICGEKTFWDPKINERVCRTGCMKIEDDKINAHSNLNESMHCGKQQKTGQNTGVSLEDNHIPQSLLSLDPNNGFSFRDNNDGIFAESINSRNEVLLKDNKNQIIRGGSLSQDYLSRLKSQLIIQTYNSFN